MLRPVRLFSWRRGCWSRVRADSDPNSPLGLRKEHNRLDGALQLLLVGSQSHENLDVHIYIYVYITTINLSEATYKPTYTYLWQPFPYESKPQDYSQPFTSTQWGGLGLHRCPRTGEKMKICVMGVWECFANVAKPFPGAKSSWPSLLQRKSLACQEELIWKQTWKTTLVPHFTWWSDFESNVF